jgi:FkbM family methyltransferase
VSAAIHAIKDVRDRVILAATFWKKTVRRKGITLTLDQASPYVRQALLTTYEATDAELARKLLVPDDRVLELGSSIGFMALHCLKNIGVADYAMVEANRGLAPVIAQNFALNGVPLPRVLYYAAGADDGEAIFHVGSSYISSSLLDHPRHARPVTVPQRTIPSIIAELPFRPNVLIMDIEGAEKDIPLAHWAGFDKLIVEFHGRYVGHDTIERIAAGLATLGYREAARAGASRAYLREGQD